MEHATSTALKGRTSEPPARYDDDPCAWAMQQAELPEAGRSADFDRVDLADEIAGVARRDFGRLEGDLTRVIQHLLRWDRQLTQRGHSRVNGIREHRRRVDRQLQQDRSLEARRDEALQEAFERRRAAALVETEVPDAAFPASDPYSWDEALTRPVLWPEP